MDGSFEDLEDDSSGGAAHVLFAAIIIVVLVVAIGWVIVSTPANPSQKIDRAHQSMK